VIRRSDPPNALFVLLVIVGFLSAVQPSGPLNTKNAPAKISANPTAWFIVSGSFKTHINCGEAAQRIVGRHSLDHGSRQEMPG